MDDQFEKDLRKRISEVFDNYEDTTADEGWQQLREKFPEEAKRRPVAWLWWSSAAAVLLVFLGILWLKQTPEKQQQFTVKNHGNTVQPQAPAVATTQTPASSGMSARPERGIAGKASNNSAVPKIDEASALTQVLTKGNKSGTTGKTAQQRTVVTSAAIASNQNNNRSNQNTASQVNSATTQTVKPEENINSNSGAASIAAVTRPDSAISKASGSNAAASAGTDLTKNQRPDNGLLAYNSVPSKPKGLPGESRIRFGVYAATFFNYAKGSNSQFNIGAGITTDIKITKKLKLSTGIAIAQNSLSYGGQPVTPVPQGINTAPLALYSASTLQYSMSEPSFKSYNANLVGIDIPVDLKYTFDPGKTETYLLAGLSSGTFLNETYTYNFNGAPPFNPATHNNSGFYFGRTLNLAIGTGYRFGNNRLIIEPFLKYPLDGMGAQQIRFGSGGVNLRFNIPSIKR